MNYRVSIQIRAIFLLVVFSLNTIIGFACAIGIDMGYNSTHHAEKDIPRAASHSHGHEHEASSSGHDNHGKTNHHAAEHHVAGNSQEDSKSDDCCSNEITNLLQEEKSLASPLSIEHPGLEYFNPATFDVIEASFHNSVDKDKKYFVRQHHPPIPDIRIAIQSFQI